MYGSYISRDALRSYNDADYLIALSVPFGSTL